MYGERLNSQDYEEKHNNPEKYDRRRAKEERVKKKISLAAGAVALILLVTGCNGGEAIDEPSDIDKTVKRAEEFVDVDTDSWRLTVVDEDGFETSQDNNNVNKLTEMEEFNGLASCGVECRMGEKYDFDTLTVLDSDGDGDWDEIQEYVQAADVTLVKKLNEDEQSDVKTLSTALGKMNAAKQKIAEEVAS